MPRAETIKKNAADIKKWSLLIKGASITLMTSILLVSVIYLVSFFYDRYSSFSVSVNKNDMVKQGLTLSETGEFDKPIARLDADAIKDCTNISGDNLPENIDMINGEHSGSDYLAYTFYLKNTGEDTLTYKYSITISNVTLNVDAAIRCRLYVNGESFTYAKTKDDGSGPENNTEEFLTLSTITEKYIRNFKPGDQTKFTVVFWLEGDDPECVDSIIGGRFKSDMKISIVEGS